MSGSVAVRKVRLSLSPQQHAFVADVDAPIVALVGGMGAGKTFAAARKALALGLLNSPTVGIWVEPTFALQRDAAEPAFAALLDEVGLPARWNRSAHTVVVGGAAPFTLHFRSGEAAERLIAINAGWALIDEPGVQSEEVAQRVVTRVRDARAKHPQIALTGTPEGFNWFHRWVVVDAAKMGTHAYHIRTRDNRHLGPGYAERMERALDDAQRAAYLDGQFVPRGSRVYSRFDRATHICPAVDLGHGELIVGADFNVSIMTWLIIRVVGSSFHVVDEVTTRDTDTWAQCAALADALRRLCVDAGRYHRDELDRRGSVTVHADASGGARKTSAARSDIDIIRSEGFQVARHVSNPPVRDRVAAIQAALAEGRLHVDPRCTRLVAALEQQGYDDAGQPSKAEGHDHVLDALGYAVYWREPVRAVAPGRGLTYDDFGRPVQASRR